MSATSPDTEHDAPPPYSSDQSNPDTFHEAPPPYSPNRSNPDSPPPDSPGQDSTFGDGRRASLTQSLPGAVLDYREEYGRTYHNYEGCQYLFPNDERELDRLDLQHQMFLILFGRKLFLAPISPSPHNILDIGTGTGIWAIDMAGLYPSASVIGIDISPTQPKWLPPNCTFEVDDANMDWTFTQKFDFINCRQLHMAVEERRLFRQSMDALKEDGWLEIKEFAPPLCYVNNTLNGKALAAWGKAMMEASRKIKTPFDNPHKYRQWMEEAGFVNVEESIYRVPLNWWSDPEQKEVGMAQMLNFLEGIEGFSLALFREHLKWSREELEVLLARVREDIHNRGIRAYWTLVCVIGQKPLTSVTPVL